MSYFIHDPYFFANVTNQSFESTTLGRVFICNHITSSVFGFILISLVIYMILFRSPLSLQNFRKILLVIHVVDLMIWIVFTSGALRTHFVNGVGLHAFSGIISQLSFDIQMVVHVIAETSALSLFVILPLPLWYRDHLLRYGPPSNLTFFRSIGLLLVVLGVSTGLFGSAIYTTDYTDDYSSFWFQETPIPAVVVRDPQHNFFALLSLNYDGIVVFGSFLISVLIALRTYRLLKTQVQEAGRRSKTMDQFTRVIFAQMLIPTFSLFLPTLVLGIMVSNGITNDISQNFMVMLLGWIPSFNCISTLVFIVPYRRVIFSKFKQLNASSVSFIPSIVVPPVKTVR
ncbi:hypothetical protein M3Y95_01291600 [Aphelenchoides besseyi]|nr:hypothetical protein M3Y95_01291600 [Aphelenchoides besseyi]